MGGQGAHLQAVLEAVQSELEGLHQKLDAEQESSRKRARQSLDAEQESRRKRARQSLDAAGPAGAAVTDLRVKLDSCETEKSEMKRKLDRCMAQTHELERKLAEAERRRSEGDSHAAASQRKQAQGQQQQAQAPSAAGAEKGGAGGGEAAAAAEPVAIAPAAGEHGMQAFSNAVQPARHCDVWLSRLATLVCTCRRRSAGRCRQLRRRHDDHVIQAG